MIVFDRVVPRVGVVGPGNNAGEISACPERVVLLFFVGSEKVTCTVE